jgi:hypothetical protein
VTSHAHESLQSTSAHVSGPLQLTSQRPAPQVTRSQEPGVEHATAHDAASEQSTSRQPLFSHVIVQWYPLGHRTLPLPRLSIAHVSAVVSHAEQPSGQPEPSSTQKPSTQLRAGSQSACVAHASCSLGCSIEQAASSATTTSALTAHRW